MAAGDASAVPIKNAAYRVYFWLFDAAGNPVHSTGNPDSEYNLDGSIGGFADCTNEATHVGHGYYYLDLINSEMNADNVGIHIASDDALEGCISLYPQSTDFSGLDDDHTSILIDAGSILSDTQSLLVDTGSILTDTSTMVPQVTSILIDTTSILIDTSTMVPQVASILVDTISILADMGADSNAISSILTDTNAIAPQVSSILAGMGAADNQISSILVDTNAMSPQVSSILDDTRVMVPGAAVNLHIEGENLSVS